MAAGAASCDLSTGSSVYDTPEKKTNGLRLLTLLVEGGTAILRKFLYFVYPPENLQVVLNKNEAKLQRLKSKGVIFAIQWEMLFPPSGDPPNAEVHLLLRNICYLKAPSTGWHEMPPHDDDKRKVGEGEEYEDCMEKAEKLYLEHKMKFGENLLSEVIYLHSHARLISEKRIPDKPEEVYEKALKICEQKLPNHPERVATLLFAGRNAKRRNEYEQAEEQLNQALNLSKNCPGEHVMTVQCFKDIADLRFFVKRKVLKGERSFDTVLPYYEKSLEMLEHLGMDGHKETILTLKNCGFCHSSNGNYEKARKFLERAERVSERELENDHRWKVMVKTQQALVFDKENKEDQMIEAMKSGLKMCYKLGKTIEDLGNKHEIRKVLHRHPNKFPKDEYPR